MYNSIYLPHLNSVINISICRHWIINSMFTSSVVFIWKFGRLRFVNGLIFPTDTLLESKHYNTMHRSRKAPLKRNLDFVYCIPISWNTHGYLISFSDPTWFVRHRLILLTNNTSYIGDTPSYSFRVNALRLFLIEYL